MSAQLTRTACLLLAVGISLGTAHSASANGHEMPHHARAAAVQSQQLHHALARQFNLSPYAARICEVTHDIDELACRLERELQLCCTNQQAAHLVRRLDRKVCQLNSVFRAANHRAQVGIDPPVGCTLAIEAKLRELTETVHCLKTQVLHYQPVQHSHGMVGRSHGHDIHGGGSRSSRSVQDTRYTGRSVRSRDRGGLGVTLQRGNFRISFGG